MTALDRKLLRDLVQMKGQAAAIGPVIACGVAVFVMSVSTHGSLERTLDAYYERYRFAQVFAPLKRAPIALADRISAIPGVAQVQTRIVAEVTLDVPGLAEPATGRLISLPDRPGPGLNDRYLRGGRPVEPGRPGEVLASEGFVQANALAPGAALRAVLNGRMQRLRIVGLVRFPSGRGPVALAARKAEDGGRSPPRAPRKVDTRSPTMRCLILLLATAAWLVQECRAVGADEPKGDAAGRPAALPLTEVILYSSGVGHFRRDGRVDGSAQVDLRFKVDDINDLLKSMIVQDLDGGQVAAVTYGSRDPVAKTLKSFGVDLTDNPTLGDLLNQVRGERIEVASPNLTTGTILGVETKKRPVGEKDGQVVETQYLNLLTDEGLRTIALEQVQRLKMLNERLAAELRQALEVLAAGHDTQKKTVELRFDGEGKRRVSVAYIAQTPVWKTSYRLVLDDEKAPYLQGWAIVENTTDDDWDGVRLALISGRPISFVMDLYQPLYAPRPEVQPELYLSLRPQVYGQAMNEEMEMAAAAPEAPPASGMMEGMGGMGGGMGGGARDMPARARAMMAAPAPMAAAEPAMSRRGLDLKQGVGAGASGLQAGELFQYAIRAPVTLARQRSAMLPILGEEVQGRKVSIYNEAVQPKHPLNGFRLKNTSALHLMQGPITVFDAGAYAGDARIEDLAPGGERLISYALDLPVEVEPQHKGGPQDLISVALRKGTLLARRRATDETVYNVKNRDQKEKTVLIEHPLRPEWQLTDPKEPAERTRDLYRFAVKVAIGQNAALRVAEERPYTESIALTNLGPDVLAYYLSQRVVGDRVKEALRRVAELRNVLEQTRAEAARRTQRTGEIAQEQGRIRENMARLAPNSELYNRYVTKLDQQETELEGLRKEIEGLRDTEARQQQALNDYLMGLDLEG